MSFTTIHMPSKAVQMLLSGSPVGIILPKRHISQGQEHVKAEGVNSAKPLRISDPLDLEGFIPVQIASICGFANAIEALEFARTSYQKADLELKDLMAYYIHAY